MNRSAIGRCLLAGLSLFILVASLGDSVGQGADPPAANPLPRQPLVAGDHLREMTVDRWTRKYMVHVPPQYDPARPTPVVLALHGAAMTGPMMAWFCGMNKKSDAAGFIVVYPSGTGQGPLLTWNAGGLSGPLAAGRPDDVAFIRALLTELETLLNVDRRRVYACGLSNGAMMCYRLAAELSDRIAAIAPVAGTVAMEKMEPGRPVSVLHLHGTRDELVPYTMTPKTAPPFVRFKGVEESIRIWVEINGCQPPLAKETLSQTGDELTVTRTRYPNGKQGTEVQLIVIEGGGHTWPGQKPPVAFLGKSAMNISANDLIWEFFEQHPLP